MNLQKLEKYARAKAYAEKHKVEVERFINVKFRASPGSSWSRDFLAILASKSGEGVLRSKEEELHKDLPEFAALGLSYTYAPVPITEVFHTGFYNVTIKRPSL